MRVALSVALCVLCASVTNADIVYVFENQSTTIGGGLDGVNSGVFTQAGVAMTATATTAGEASPEFNATANFFGINQAASGDDTDGFDFTNGMGAGGAEGLTLSFDQSVQLVSIDVESFGASDEVTIFVGGTTVATITSTGSTSLGNFALPANTDVEILTTAGSYGNGWSLVSFTVTPEPGAASLLAIAGLFTLPVRRRRKPLAA